VRTEGLVLPALHTASVTSVTFLLDAKAYPLAGSFFSVLFRFVGQAHRHEQGLGVIFVILQNDSYDHFCTANNRAISN
jgi:hypothetical protein